MSLTDIIKPIITEKTLRLAKNNQYTFSVSLSASKSTVKQAIEDLFEVTVLKVNIVNLPGKIRRSGKKRLASKTADRKKAITTLKPGDTIESFQSSEKVTVKEKKKNLKIKKNKK